ncbi:zinc-dependent alcohol dehydrogenase [Natribacillus halophilus]|uniref:L-iditol 2-dehydrogenase n=1 Tax=Natribacillus halophilus TaxID=549003 RepID=A0A1G8SLE6_9BACI|nr:alcohol dehydrogenase catalytic domain-containing protein [Natribacillus halophilus]SDJ30072.1 L-iditol 2-dehydrogenase [Natribacillus halophilus]
METVVVDQVHHLSIKKQRIPKLNSDEVLIKVSMAGICGSDIHAFNGNHPFRIPPVSIGHELSGEIVEIGSRVRYINKGSRVSVIPQLGCGGCRYCKSDQKNLCVARRAPGVNEWLGTMAEYFIAPVSSVIELPQSISHKAGVMLEPLAVGFHAVDQAEINENDKVAILGAGPIGLVTLLASISKGAKQNLITDVRNYPLEVGAKLGAQYTVDITKYDNWIEAAMEKVEDSFDKVIIATEAPDIINQALHLTAKGGKIVIVAMFNEKQSVKINDLQGKEKEIIGCMTYHHQDFEEAVKFLGSGSSNIASVENIISHVLPYREAQKGFEMAAQSKEDVLKVILSF